MSNLAVANPLLEDRYEQTVTLIMVSFINPTKHNVAPKSIAVFYLDGQGQVGMI